MSELIDFYDANMRHNGVATRAEAHRDALWHRTFHCWVISSEAGGSILFQLRSVHTENFPGLYDVSAAGHILAGETPADELRELGEELGIDVASEAVHFLGIRVEVADKPNGYRDREFQAVHMVQLEAPLAKYQPQASEVDGLVWLRVGAATRLFTGESARESGAGIRYDEKSGRWKPFSPVLTIGAFVPRQASYYLAICIMAERLLQGKLPLAVL